MSKKKENIGIAATKADKKQVIQRIDGLGLIHIA